MIVRPFFSGNQTNVVLQAALEGHSIRHKAILNNIANVDTPGYQRVEVSFEDQLKKLRNRLIHEEAKGREDSSPSPRRGEIPGMQARVKVDKSPPIRADGSNVQIETETVDLAKNTSRHVELTELLIRNYITIKSAIRGRSA